MQTRLTPDWRHYIPAPPSIITEESWQLRNDLAAKHYPQIVDLLTFDEDRLVGVLTEVEQDEKPPAEFPVGAPGSSRPLAWLPKRSHLEWHLFRNIVPGLRRRPIPATVRALVLERDGLTCQICFDSVSPDDVHLDHIRPHSRGGLETVGNLRVTHSTCNMKRGAPSEWHASEPSSRAFSAR